MSLLKLSHVSAFYGASQALFDVHLNVEDGQVLAMMAATEWAKQPLSR